MDNILLNVRVQTHVIKYDYLNLISKRLKLTIIMRKSPIIFDSKRKSNLYMMVYNTY